MIENEIDNNIEHEIENDFNNDNISNVEISNENEVDNIFNEELYTNSTKDNNKILNTSGYSLLRELEDKWESIEKKKIILLKREILKIISLNKKKRKMIIYK